jgi:DNA primase
MDRTHAQRVLFEQLKRTVPIAAILAKYNIELKRSGTSLKGCCPIHNGSNPNQFHVDENKGLWKCFSPSCSRGGDMLSLVAAMEKVEIREAALLVAEWFHIKPGGEVQHRDQQRSKAMSETNRPTHTVHSAQKREGQKDFLTRIGSGWEFSTKDGRKGVRIQLSALPHPDGMVIFEAGAEEPDEDDKSNGKRRK